MKRMFWVCLLFFGLFVCWTVLVGADFYVIPVKGQVTSWDKKISGAARFTLVLDGAAALDKETGLVWEKSPYWTGSSGTSTKNWNSASSHCYHREVSVRKGWRLPTIEELASLVDTSGPFPALPAGHPFTNVQAQRYWSSTTTASPTSHALVVHFNGGSLTDIDKTSNYFVWCVRGGYGHDAY